MKLTNRDSLVITHVVVDMISMCLCIEELGSTYAVKKQ